MKPTILEAAVMTAAAIVILLVFALAITPDALSYDEFMRRW